MGSIESSGPVNGCERAVVDPPELPVAPPLAATVVAVVPPLAATVVAVAATVVAVEPASTVTVPVMPLDTWTLQM